MMHNSKFGLGALVTLEPPKGRVTEVRFGLDPNTGERVVWYDIMTTHGPITNIPESELFRVDEGKQPEYAKAVPQRGDIAYAETLGGTEVADNVAQGPWPEPGWPQTDQQVAADAIGETLGLPAGYLKPVGAQMADRRANQVGIPALARRRTDAFVTADDVPTPDYDSKTVGGE